MWPKYRVRLSVVVDLVTYGRTPTGAIREAKAIAEEMVITKGLTLVSTFAEDVQMVDQAEPKATVVEN